MRAFVAVALLFVLGGHAAAQPDLQTTLLGMYKQTLGGMQKATTADDVERIVNAIDTPDWVSINADGARLTREQSKQELVRSLAGTRDDQPTIELLCSFTLKTQRRPCAACLANPAVSTRPDNSDRRARGTNC